MLLLLLGFLSCRQSRLNIPWGDSDSTCAVAGLYCCSCRLAGCFLAAALFLPKSYRPRSPGRLTHSPRPSSIAADPRDSTDKRVRRVSGQVSSRPPDLERAPTRQAFPLLASEACRHSKLCKYLKPASCWTSLSWLQPRASREQPLGHERRSAAVSWLLSGPDQISG